MKKTELIYGIHSIESVLQQSPERILKLIVASGRNDKRLEKLIANAKQQHIFIEPRARKELDKLIENVPHQGVVAQCRSKKVLMEADLVSLLDNLNKPPLLLILDGVQDPHNLGACLRTADAAGVDAVIVPKDKAVGLTETVQKIASGAAETIPFVQVTNLVRSIQTLKERNIWVFGFSDAAKESVYQANFTGAAALVLGAEGKGLRRLTQEQCDALYAIPMAGSVSSLNVSVAAGVCLFEAVRQRQA